MFCTIYQLFQYNGGAISPCFNAAVVPLPLRKMMLHKSTKRGLVACYYIGRLRAEVLIHRFREVLRIPDGIMFIPTDYAFYLCAGATRNCSWGFMTTNMMYPPWKVRVCVCFYIRYRLLNRTTRFVRMFRHVVTYSRNDSCKAWWI